jgi:hypothetical protein
MVEEKSVEIQFVAMEREKEKVMKKFITFLFSFHTIKSNRWKSFSGIIIINNDFIKLSIEKKRYLIANER